MVIHGMNKLTLLDYPGHIACTLFTGGCNLRCPFCQNASLVLFPDSQAEIPMEEIWTFLEKRKGVLEGVCVTGGEPTLSADLPDFLAKIQSLGFLVKLDTNGTNPKMLQEILERRLVNYVAMDIKSSPSRYGEAAGIPGLDVSGILASAELLMQSGIPYEFRTTVMRELHGQDTFLEIARWLEGADAYYLQAFEDSGELVTNFSENPRSFSSYSKDELQAFLNLLEPYFKKTGLRGIH